MADKRGDINDVFSNYLRGEIWNIEEETINKIGKQKRGKRKK